MNCNAVKLWLRPAITVFGPLIAACTLTGMAIACVIEARTAGLWIQFLAAFPAMDALAYAFRVFFEEWADYDRWKAHQQGHTRPDPRAMWQYRIANWWKSGLTLHGSRVAVILRSLEVVRNILIPVLFVWGLLLGNLG